jgi:hypothetical protein
MPAHHREPRRLQATGSQNCVRCEVQNTTRDTETQASRQAINSRTTREERRAELLEPSREKIDEGELVGKDPRKLSPQNLALLLGAKSPLKAIRERCLDCCVFSPAEVRKCVLVDCPSWPFRLGTNPYRAKRVLSDEQKAKMVERLRGAA